MSLIYEILIMSVDLVITIPFILFLLSFIVNIILFVKLRNKKQVIQQSQELTDFFRDINTKGYSFCRIDPDSIYLRRK